MLCVFIHGPVAAGKLTVARALQSRSGLPLFHNHLAVDAALALFPFGSPEFVRLRHAIWIAGFREAAASGRSFIFTFHPEASVPPAFIGEAVSIVEGAGGRVVFVALTCAEGEIERRISDPSRTMFRKLGALDDYRRLRDSGAFAFQDLPPAALEIATDRRTPGDAAAEIHRLLT